MARIYLERREMGEELKRLFDLLETQTGAGSPPGECSPPVDVIETPAQVEVIIDLPGVAHEDLHVVFARGSVLVAGVKRSHVCSHSDAAFHMAERAFGRFARAIRLAGAVDAGHARATLAAGELRIVVPRIAERRGREIRIPIEIA